MNIAQIEINLQKLIVTFNRQNFIYELLLAYGLPKASITRLKKGNLNLSKVEGEISWKKKLFFKEEYTQDLHLTISEITKDIKHNERFVIVTDYKTLLAVDIKTEDKLDCVIEDLSKHYDFFLPWAGMEKAQHTNENPADVKAAEKMAKLFDEIKKDNPNDSPEFIHGLNVFLSRLLFCFFAEDTHIFVDSQFINAIDSHTQTDGSDLNTYLDTLFTVLNTPENERKDLPEYLSAFPYVNGGLFEKEYTTPKLSYRSRAAILSSGDQNWSAINPDIFGSMFQAVIGADQRGSLGQHYTSVPNIMKVIEPLFLNELYEEFDVSTSSATKVKQKKLEALLHRIHNIKIFDPACGSGNFLIIAYKELRILEMKILKQLKILSGTLGSGNIDFGNDYLSHIHLSQFYGIEIDDFAGEIAKLALWLAEHQMNVEFYKEFGRTNPTLPLKEAGKIVQGNATRLDWGDVCPKKKGDKIYILGNPPYLGGKSQSKEQKKDMDIVFQGIKKYKELDYIASWFYKAATFLNNNSSYAFVTTSSINQGAQVVQLWPLIFNRNLEIFFVCLPFQWTNNAKANAGVSVSIIGIKNKSEAAKIIYSNGLKNSVNNINAYLSPSNNVIVNQKLSSISNLPVMITGNSPYENNNLRFDTETKNKLIKDYPQCSILIRKTLGANELLNNLEKWCLWITDADKELAMSIPPIKTRILDTKEFRLNGGDVARGIANRPHQFRYTHTSKKSQIIIPIVSSERREYIPIGFTNNNSIIISSAAAIYDPEPFVFGILSSKIHNSWVRINAGRLDSRVRYLSALCWNTFPFPQISTQRKNEITQSAFRILEEREKHSDKTLAQLYDPDKMPDGLREAHRQNDIIIEKCYRSTPFNSDEERLEYLFKLYEKMIAEEKEQGTLFAKEKKTKKRKK